ncbi:MAG: flavin reductase family protein [Acidimicrobiales bacterium]|jgi:flavin reductase (DIM6/NTAB) family NADH-FMN oxidoreductase RutF
MVQRGDLVGPFPDGVDPEGYDRMRRRVLWRLPMGLYLLGTSAGERKNLMTLNWAMQVSTEPKHLAVSVERSALTHELLLEGNCYALSLISKDDRAVVRKFVKPAQHDAAAATLNGMGYITASTGAPIAEIAVAWLDCEVRQHLEAGSHSIFVGEVVDAGGGDEASPVLAMEDTRMSYGG